MQIFTHVILLFVITSISSGFLKRKTKRPLLGIVHGNPVPIHGIPYQAALRYRVYSGWTHLCGASIISNRAVLSAAHCVTSGPNTINPSNIQVITETSYTLGEGKKHDVSRIFVHEHWDFGTFKNDISLLVTVEEIVFNANAQPTAIAPADKHLPVGTESVVSGYGATSLDAPNSSELRKAKVNIVDQTYCKKAYNDVIDISSIMICASASNPFRDACQGDSGGPLVANGYIVGIVSFGQGCAHPDFPGVYTRVSKFNNWIKDKLSHI